MFSDQELEQVRRAVNIVEVVRPYVRRVDGHKALCPFHEDKNPSLSLDPAKGLYHCFGCGESGDVFRFVMKAEGLRFPDAVRKVAALAGIHVGGNGHKQPQRRLHVDAQGCQGNSELRRSASIDIKKFAALKGVRFVRHEDGELIIPGKLGHIFAHDPEHSKFGLVLAAPTDDSSFDNTLRARKRKAAGQAFELHQEGEYEAILLFDATDRRKGDLALRLVSARRKRKQSPAQLANLRRGSEKRVSQRLEAPKSTDLVVGVGL